MGPMNKRLGNESTDPKSMKLGIQNKETKFIDNWALEIYTLALIVQIPYLNCTKIRSRLIMAVLEVRGSEIRVN